MPTRKAVDVLELSGLEVGAPRSLNMRDSVVNETLIASWWQDVKLYARAMEALGRFVLLKFHEEENTWYFESIESTIALDVD